MCQRLLLLLMGLALLGTATCTDWQDETKGRALQTTTTAAQGGGGGGACMSCNDFFTASSSCQDPDCPSEDEVCAGASQDALDAFFDCAYCDACPSECPGECGGGGSGGGGMSAACQTCLIGALSGQCATQYSACTQN